MLQAQGEEGSLKRHLLSLPRVSSFLPVAKPLEPKVCKKVCCYLSFQIILIALKRLVSVAWQTLAPFARTRHLTNHDMQKVDQAEQEVFLCLCHSRVAQDEQYFSPWAVPALELRDLAAVTNISIGSGHRMGCRGEDLKAVKSRILHPDCLCLGACGFKFDAPTTDGEPWCVAVSRIARQIGQFNHCSAHI